MEQQMTSELLRVNLLKEREGQKNYPYKGLIDPLEKHLHLNFLYIWNKGKLQQSKAQLKKKN